MRPSTTLRMPPASIDVSETINEYLSRSDWRVHANANQDFSLGGLMLNTNGKVVANYWLNEVFHSEAGQAHRNGDIHIHDLDMLSGYCAGWSLRQLLQEGFGGVPGTISSGPPKHFSPACGQVVNFLGTLQNEWAGAQAFSSFDTYMAPFVRLDNLTYEQVEQTMQELIFNLNVPSRWGTQTPFTNLTFDWVCPADLADEYPLIGDEVCDFTYGELGAEMDMINRAFISVMSAGDVDGRPFTFPIPTYNITKDFDWDSPNAKALFEMTAQYGLPYFQNFINSDMDPGMIRSMCCRLQLDLRELLKRGNGLFGSAEHTGSIGVVTLNCARLGYRFRGRPEAEMLEEVTRLVRMGVDTLERRRSTINEFMGLGLFPYTARWLPDLDNHFSTIGVNGCNEMIRNYTEDAYDNINLCFESGVGFHASRFGDYHTAFDFVFVDTAQEQTYVISGFTSVKDFAEHFNSGNNRFFAFGAKSDNLNFFSGVDNSGFDTSGSNGSASCDRKYVFNRHQERFVDIAGRQRNPFVNGSHKLHDFVFPFSVSVQAAECRTLNNGSIVAVEIVE